MYEYQANVLDIHDGDTLHAEVDLGVDVKIRLTLRLAGINAPELSTPQGPPARDHLAELLHFTPSTVCPISIKTVKDHKEKYGRYLAYISSGGVNVNDQMVHDGFAVPYTV